MNISAKRLNACKNKHNLNEQWWDDEWDDVGTAEYEKIGTKHCVECGWSGRGEFHDTIFGDMCWVCYEDMVHTENGLSEKYLADQYLSVVDGDTSILDKHRSNLKQIVDKLAKAWRKYRKDFMNRMAYWPSEIKEFESEFNKIVAEYLADGDKKTVGEEFRDYENLWDSLNEWIDVSGKKVKASISQSAAATTPVPLAKKKKVKTVFGTAYTWYDEFRKLYKHIMEVNKPVSGVRDSGMWDTLFRAYWIAADGREYRLEVTTTVLVNFKSIEKWDYALSVMDPAEKVISRGYLRDYDHLLDVLLKEGVITDKSKCI